MITEELKTAAVRVQSEIEALNSLVEKHPYASLKAKIKAIKAHKESTPSAHLSYNVTDTNTPGSNKPITVVSQHGGSFVEEFEAMEQLISELSELCDKISLLQ